MGLLLKTNQHVFLGKNKGMRTLLFQVEQCFHLFQYHFYNWICKLTAKYFLYDVDSMLQLDHVHTSTWVKIIWQQQQQQMAVGRQQQLNNIDS
jgi:hypothetical protein